MNTKVKSVCECGNGASGSVYRLKITSHPYQIAVKSSEFYDNLSKERKMIDFLSERVSYKVPKTYFLYKDNDIAFLAMDYIKGISGKSKLVEFIPNRKRLKNSIIDALMNAQSVQNKRFGKYDNPVYDTWKEYYADYFADIYNFTKAKYERREIETVVMDAVERIRINFDKIFDKTSDTACLCHGDFHYANILWREKRLVGVLDWELAGIGNKEFDIAWSIINRPSQKFLKTKEEVEEFLRGYKSVGEYNRDYVEYYMVLVYSHFISFNTNTKDYIEFVKNVLKDKIKINPRN